MGHKGNCIPNGVHKIGRQCCTDFQEMLNVGDALRLEVILEV